MNDDPELGPAAGMVEAAALRSQLATKIRWSATWKRIAKEYRDFYHITFDQAARIKADNTNLRAHLAAAEQKLAQYDLVAAGNRQLTDQLLKMRTRAEKAEQRAEQAEELAAKLHAIIQENTLNNIDWAARVQELGDDNERLRELVKLHMAADLARADLDRD